MAIQIRRGTESEWEAGKQNIVVGEPCVTTDTGRFFVGTEDGFSEMARMEDIGTFEESIETLQGEVDEINEALETKADKSDTYSKEDVDGLLEGKANVEALEELSEQLDSKADSSAVYTKTETDTLLSAKASASDLEELAEDVDGKASADGLYPDMVAGGLIEQTGTTDKEPYQYRKSFSGAREWDTLVGGTVAWNQLVDKPDTWAVGIKAFPSGTQFVAGHKVLFSLDGTLADPSGATPQLLYYCKPTDGSAGESKRAVFGFGKGIISLSTTQVANGQANVAGAVWLYISNRSNINNVYVEAFDLTQMFGSTIADYVYNLETATTGSGIAWLKKYIDLDSYHAYTQPTLESVSGVSEHKMVGFNQWDEEWEGGGIANATGLNFNTSDRIRSKNFNPCLPNTTYYNKIPISYSNIFYYDNSKTFISQTPVTVGGTFTTPQNCAYFRFSVQPDYGNTYNHDICINISDTAKNGTYEPYSTWSYPLDSSLTLRGVPKLVNNQIAYNGDTYEADGTVTRRYGFITIDGTKGTFSTPNTNQFNIDNLSISYLKHGSWITYISDGYDAVAQTADNASFLTETSALSKAFNLSSNSTTIRIKDTGYTTVDSFKTYLSSHPITIVYELATPTTETAEPFVSPQEVDGNGTERYITTSLLPIGHDTTYKQIQSGIPNVPTANGTYTLKCVVSNGNAVVQWIQ